MDKKKVLTENELQYWADHLSEISEDGLEQSDEDENDILPQDLEDLIPLDIESDVFDIENVPIIYLPDLEPNNCDNIFENNLPSFIIPIEEKRAVLSEKTEGNLLSENSANVIVIDKNELRVPLVKSISNKRQRKNKEAKENTGEEKIKKPVGGLTKENRTCEEKENDDRIKRKKLADEEAKLKKSLTKLIWKKGNLVMREETIKFRGNVVLPATFHDLETPYDFFKYFFDDTLVSIIVEQSNLFTIQSTPVISMNMKDIDVKRYLGICILMSVIHLPNLRSYWSDSIGTDIIKNTMSQKNFEKIKQRLHFNDNSKMLPKEHENHDRLHKIRPVIDHLLKLFQTVPYESCLSVDEQMCPTKTKSYLKQYMPAKPHKWGFKVYVVSGISGYTYNFEIYTGQENRPNQNEMNLGACANIVTRLLRHLPKDMNYRVYFDNFYTTIPLLTQLAHYGILSLGTIRRNRIPNCPLPNEKELNKESRGTSQEYITEMEGVPITSVVWKDNKVVTLVSSFCGTLPKEKVSRYDKTQNRRVEVDCPNLVKEYNKHMGGVDLMDSLIGRYRIKIKSRKWYFRMFYHLLDLTLVNAWLLYRRVNEEKGNKKTIRLADFRTEIGETLCMMGVRQNNSRGRKSDIEKQLQEKMRSHKCFIPPKEVRTDESSHWPVWMDKRLRCKLPKSGGFTYVSCQKCSAALCLNKSKNCFRAFHT